MAIYVSDQVPEVVVGDPGRFRQIITNLVGNSIKVVPLFFFFLFLFQFHLYEIYYFNTYHLTKSVCKVVFGL